MDTRTLGILGGGQLGRMLVEAAHRLNVKTVVLDGENAPAKQINALSEHVNGSFADAAAISELAARCDVLTVEIEHVNADHLLSLQTATGIEIHPSPATIKTIQDKFLQKEHLQRHGISIAPSQAVESSVEAIQAAGTAMGYPFMLKSRTMAYDGRGNFVVDSASSAARALEFLADRPLYAEKWAPFTKELAVMVVRKKDGTVLSYPTVETIQQENICHLVYAPARGVADSVRQAAQTLAENAVKSFSGAGIFGVEMFLLPDGELLVNEIAPRPHNSGHYTIDACVSSQFDAHIRAVMGLPLPGGAARLATPQTNAIMLNIIGGTEPGSELAFCRRALETPNASVYLYGKTTRPKRKMGHVNIVAPSMFEAEAKLGYILGEVAELPAEADPRPAPLVGVIMGSDSDLPVMAAAAETLKKFGVPFEVTIVSAHRTPFRMAQYASEAAGRGLKAIIAGAGGAAHLPGMVAAMTTLPVIGVPVKGSTLDGVDSLHSIVQMPRGVPVATVAINNSTNAALLAVRLLGAFMPELYREMSQYMQGMETEVLGKAEKLERIGYAEYLAKK